MHAATRFAKPANKNESVRSVSNRMPPATCIDLDALLVYARVMHCELLPFLGINHACYCHTPEGPLAGRLETR